MNPIDYPYQKMLILDDFLPDSQEKIKNFQCFFCRGIAYKPIANENGNIYCENCYQIYHSLNSLSTDMKINPKISAYILDSLNRQNVKCKNRLKGCKWTGMLKDLENHSLQHCPFQIIFCPNEPCSEQCTRSNLNQHLNQCQFKMDQCEYCNIKLAQNDLSAHQMNCDLRKVMCKLCQAFVLHSELQNHFEKKCPYIEVSCPFMEIGCHETMYRKDLIYHLEHYSIKHSFYSCKLNKQMSHVFNEFKKRTNERLLQLENSVNVLTNQNTILKQNQVYDNDYIPIKKENDNTNYIRSSICKRSLSAHYNNDNNNNNNEENDIVIEVDSYNSSNLSYNNKGSHNNNTIS